MSDVLFIRNIPADVKRGFKKACVNLNISMNDAIVGLMQGWVHGMEGKECSLLRRSSESTTSPARPTDTSTAAPAG